MILPHDPPILPYDSVHLVLLTSRNLDYFIIACFHLGLHQKLRLPVIINDQLTLLERLVSWSPRRPIPRRHQK